VCRGRRDYARNARDPQGATPMLDVIMLAIGLGFFAVALAYVAGCERL
jgi:hypothetical protein